MLTVLDSEPRALSVSKPSSQVVSQYSIPRLFLFLRERRSYENREHGGADTADVP